MKIAVIGVGNMGRNHVRTYSAIKNVKLVAVSDLDETRGQEVAREFNAKYYKNFEELIKQEKIDAVSVCVPTTQHYRVAKKILEHPINILLEKPIALKLKEGEELIKIAERKKVIMLIGHTERFNPAVIKAKEIVKNDELGDVIAIIARRVGGYPPRVVDSNIAVDLAIHDIDIVNYLLEDLPKEIVVQKQKNFSKNNYDSVEFFLKYKKATAYLQANWITPVKIRKLNITGTKGYLELDYISQKIELYRNNYKIFTRKFENYSDFVMEFSESKKVNISITKKEPLRNEIEFFVNSIRQNKVIDNSYAVDALKISLSE